MKILLLFSSLVPCTLVACLLLPGLTGCSLLSRTQPGDDGWKYEKGVAKDKGDWARVLEMNEKEVLVAQTRVLQGQENARAALAEAYWSMGRILADMERYDQAVACFHACRKLVGKLPAAWANYLLLIEKLNSSGGDMKQAGSYLEKLADAAEKEALKKESAMKKDAQEWQKEEMGKTYSSLGNAYLSLNQPGRAMTMFEKNLAINKKLAASHPYGPPVREGRYVHGPFLGYIDAQVGLCRAYNDMGNAFLVMKEPRKAVALFEKGTALARFMVEDPDNVYFKTGVRDSYDGLGNAFLAMKQPEKALQVFEEGLKISRYFDKSSPLGLYWHPQLDLAESLMQVGQAHMALGDREKARAMFEESRDICRKLHRRHPETPAFKKALEQASLLLEEAGGVKK